MCTYSCNNNCNCYQNTKVDWTQPLKFRSRKEKIVDYFANEDDRAFIIAVSNETGDHFSITVDCDGSYMGDNAWDVINVPKEKVVVTYYAVFKKNNEYLCSVGKVQTAEDICRTIGNGAFYRKWTVAI